MQKCHASHYVKVMLDQIFGENNFQNEIVWKRTSSHSNAKRRFGDQADALLFYTGGGEDYTFHPQYAGYSESYLKSHYGNTDATGRRYTTRDLRNPSRRPNLTYDYKGYKPHPNGWSVPRELMEKLDAEGRIYFPKDKAGRLRIIRYLDEMPGTPVGNVWDDIEPLNSQAAERLGYPTQKPLALLERIVRTSSKENDVVLDAFCGCGTAIAAAQNLNRQWIGIDVSPTACRVMAKRLRDMCRLPEDETAWKMGRGFIVRDLPWSAEKLRTMPPFEFENWAVIALGGIPNKTQVGDMGIDGRIFPLGASPKKLGRNTTGHLQFMDAWYPVQVKQKDKAGRPDIDAFEAMMTRTDRTKGFFVSFDYSRDALTEIDAFFRKSGKIIILLTVGEILDEQIARKLA